MNITETVGKPILLLLPGIDGSGICLEPLAQALADIADCRIIAYPRDKEMSYQQLHDWLLPRYMPKQPFYLLAESFGGPLAIMLAESLGTRLRGLILAATFLQHPIPPVMAQLAHFGLPWLHVGMFHLLPLRFLLGSHPQQNALLQQILSTIPPGVLRARIQETLSVDVRTPYAALKTPRLVLCPMQDRLVQVNPEAFTHPKAQIELMPDAPHLLFLTHTEACARHIRAFLQNTTRVRTPRP